MFFTQKQRLVLIAIDAQMTIIPTVWLGSLKRFNGITSQTQHECNWCLATGKGARTDSLTLRIEVITGKTELVIIPPSFDSCRIYKRLYSFRNLELQANQTLTLKTPWMPQITLEKSSGFEDFDGFRSYVQLMSDTFRPYLELNISHTFGCDNTSGAGQFIDHNGMFAMIDYSFIFGYLEELIGETNVPLFMVLEKKVTVILRPWQPFFRWKKRAQRMQ